MESQSLQPHYAAGVRGAQSLLFPPPIFLGMRIRRVMVGLSMVLMVLSVMKTLLMVAHLSRPLCYNIHMKVLESC